MPNRILKESICTSDTVAALASVEAETLFYRLLVTVDDFGCYDGRTSVIRARCFPLALDRVSPTDIDNWMSDLERVGLLTRYESDGRPYICMAKWMNHQRLRATRRRWPEPPVNNLLADDSNSLSSDCQMTADCGLNPNPNPNPNPKRNPRETPPTEDGQRLARILLDLIAANHPTNPVSKLSGSGRQRRLVSWAEEIDRAVRLDGRTAVELEAIIRWAQADDFWTTNLLSPKNLRKSDKLWTDFTKSKPARSKYD